MRKKHDLPVKICPVCERPFRWRKKWMKVWDDVIYCSEKCRGSKRLQKKGLSIDPDVERYQINKN